LMNSWSSQSGERLLSPLAIPCRPIRRWLPALPNRGTSTFRATRQVGGCAGPQRGVCAGRVTSSYRSTGGHRRRVRRGSVAFQGR
jgi:hypothetical protein